MEHRDVHAFAAQPLNHKALRRFDIFEVDRPKSWLQTAHQIGKRIGIIFIDFNNKAIETGECLEQKRLAFNRRLRGLRTDVAKPQNSSAIRNHSNQIAFRSIADRAKRIGCNICASRRYAR